MLIFDQKRPQKYAYNLFYVDLNKTGGVGCKSLFSNSSALWIFSKPRGSMNCSRVNIKNIDPAAIFHQRELSRDPEGA